MRATAKILFAATVVTGGVMFAAGTASASYQANHGSDYAKTTTVNEDYLVACDKEADNNGVYGRFIVQDGSYFDGADSNGSAAGCAELDIRSTPFYTVRLEAVERNVGGGGYVWTDGLGGN